VPIRWIDAVLPFGSSYHPLWLGLGAIAFDVLIALVVTSLLRVRLGHRVWRAVHWAAYACWPLALLHGLGIGSDHRQVWLLVVDSLAIVAVAAAVWWRLAIDQAQPATSQLAPRTGSSHAHTR
jgi:DMSO/TMAO reductase YedYZ heme-binding membrane subunit